MPFNPRDTAYDAARMAHLWPWKIGAPGAAGMTLGLGAHALGIPEAALVLEIAGGATVAAATIPWWLTSVVAPQSSAGEMRRPQHLSDRHHGLATRLDVAQHASPAVLRRMAPTLRPSTQGMTRRQIRRMDPHEFGVEVARNGWGMWGQCEWLPLEECTLRIAGPRSGKTTALIPLGMCAPGGLITTSTKLDLANGVHAARMKHGPVYVFDPGDVVRPGAPGVTPVRWRVLSGCTDFETATRRAQDLLPPSEDSEREHWAAQARAILGLLLHAAAISGRTMVDVRDWASGDEDAFRPVYTALESVRHGGTARAVEWSNYCHTNARTRTSISCSMEPALSWVSDDRSRDIGDPAPNHPDLLDIASLIARGHTLHLIGRQQGSRTAPLLAALVSEVVHQARALADRSPGERLDPPLTMVIDEAATACPIALPDITADMGGRGVSLHIAVQSFAQLRAVWGTNGADTILGNVTPIIHGGSADASYLKDISDVIGDYLRQLDPDDRRNSPVMSPARLREMGPWKVVVLRRGLRPFIGYTPCVLDYQRRWWAPWRPGWAPISLGHGTRTADQVTAPTALLDTGELEAIYHRPAVDPRKDGTQ